MAFDRRTIVYGLRLDGGQIRYVGRTDYDLKRRLRQHLDSAKREYWQHRPVCRWLRSVVDMGQVKSLQIVQLASVESNSVFGEVIQPDEVEFLLIESLNDRFRISEKPLLLNVTKYRKPRRNDVVLEATR